MASSLYEPSPRFGHYSAAIGGQLHVWGGRTKDFSIEDREVSVSVHFFNPVLEAWRTAATTGEHPPDHYGGACTSSGHYLYLYGGQDRSQYNDSLYQLDTESLEWSQLPSGPMRKSGCGMVSYEDELILFGGYGIPSSPTQPGAEFIENIDFSDGRGWTNELHMFDIKKGEWFSPVVTGTMPPSCHGFSFTKVGPHHAVLFGGYGSTHGYSNYLYILDLEKMHWSELEKNVEPWPVKRTRHAAVCLWDGEDYPQLLVTGGRDENGKVLNDVWTLSLQTGRWREVEVSGLQTRCEHSATTLSLCPGVIEVTLFGGCPEVPSNYKTNADLTQIANTTVLRFEYQRHISNAGSSTGEWVLTDMADSRQLGTRQRIEEKAARMIQPIPATPKPADNENDYERRVHEAEERCREAERRLREAEDKAAEGERRLREADGRAFEAERRWKEAIEEMDKRLRASEDRAREAEGRASEEERRLREAEGRVAEGERRWREAEGRAAEGERKLNEAEDRVAEGERRLREAEGRAAEGERKLSEAEDRVAKGERRIKVVLEEKDRKVQTAEHRVREAEDRAAEREKKRREAENRAAEGERRLREVKSRAAERLRKVMEENERGTKAAEDRVREVESRVAEEQRRWREAEGKVAEREKRLREVEGRAVEGERRRREAESRAAEGERRWREAEGRALEGERMLRETEGRAAETERWLRECESRLAINNESMRESAKKLQRLETQWVVDRREIQLTGPELGRGGWATVSVATFRGVRVAAKCIHNQIISRYNMALFKREMDMAARIRHPNLLQFIGATPVGEMIILMELMPISLRKELESRYTLMPLEQVTSISLDVARALNYLHLMQPHPFIHRDISSGNVLLQPLPNSRWKAKVSDYGTVNLIEELQTANPGNPAYSAPEAKDPTKQSPKMDIFSLGVLLVEMLTGEFPDHENRAIQVFKISHQPLLALVQRCLSQDRDNRPTANDIITKLNSYTFTHTDINS